MIIAKAETLHKPHRAAARCHSAVPSRHSRNPNLPPYHAKRLNCDFAIKALCVFAKQFSRRRCWEIFYAFMALYVPLRQDNPALALGLRREQRRNVHIRKRQLERPGLTAGKEQAEEIDLVKIAPAHFRAVI